MHKKDVCSQWGDEGHISLVEASLAFPEAFFGQASTGLAAAPIGLQGSKRGQLWWSPVEAR